MEDRVYFASRKDPMEVGSFVVVEPAGPGMVRFHRAWGGFVMSATTEDFDRHYAEVPQDVALAMFSEFTEADFELGDDESVRLPGVTNGALWNGWQMPYLSVETITEAMEEGGVLREMGMNTVSRFLYLPETNDMLEIGNYDGGEFTSEVDLDGILRIAALNLPEDEAEAAYAAIGVTVTTARKVEVVPAGEAEPKTFFRIGDGWTWTMSLPAPAPAAPSASGPRM